MEPLIGTQGLIFSFVGGSISPDWCYQYGLKDPDEPITPHIISTPNSCVISSKSDNSYMNCPVLQFGAIHFDLEHSGNRAKFASSGLSSNIIFNGAVLLKNEEKKIPRSWRD